MLDLMEPKIRARVLIVDDDPQMLATLRRILGAGFDVTTADRGEAALDELAARGPFAVLLSDLKMPGMDGITLLKEAWRLAPDTVRIMLTGHGDRDRVIEAVNSGHLFRFLEKPVSNQLLVRAIDDGIAQHGRIMAEKELFAARKHHKLLTGVVGSFVRLMEARDPYTAGHQERVAAGASAIAREMGLSDRTVAVVRVAGTIHDLGKLYVPSEFLNRPGALSSLEFEIIKQHPAVGYSVLREVEFDLPLAEYVYQHHERLNGKGYPQGLKGDAIHLEARIIAVADVVEAMSSHRPYRPAKGLDQAIREIKRGRGEEYDPEVVTACLTVLEKNLWALLPTEIEHWKPATFK